MELTPEISHSPVIPVCLCHQGIFVLEMLIVGKTGLISYRKAPHSALPFQVH